MKKTLLTILALILIIPQVWAASADAEISLKIINATANNVTISINIINPSQQAVVSVQSWLKYDSSVLKGRKINTDGTPFDFVAPGENTFDDNQGLVKIGRSSISGGSIDPEVFVAEVSFERLSNKATTISFHNFQVDNSGNTSVRVFQDGFPINILKTEPSSLNIIAASGSSSDPSNPDIVDTDVPASDDSSETGVDGIDTVVEPDETLPEVIVRPSNLQVTSGPGYVVLAWDELENVKGYNIYFSQQSGRYLQRRSAGNVNEYYFDGLETGENYYFAVRAYGFQNEETDYSDEVKIKVGYPDSSTSPLLLTKSQQVLQNTTQHVQSGPVEILIMSTVLAFLGAIVFVKKRKIC